MALVSLQQVSKAYGGVRALHRVDLDIETGEVHALCGENGAGKSTLIKILGGVVRPDEGKVLVGGTIQGRGSVRQAEQSGVSVIHQESVAFPHLNAVDNLFVGRELKYAGGLLNRRQMRAQTKEILERLGEPLDVDCPVERFPLAQRQMIAIARALLHNCRLLIMDEPTASLSGKETRVLFEQIQKLRREGVSVLYVSHRLHEVFELADRVTVLRDGEKVATEECSALDESTLIQRMVGRSIVVKEERVNTSESQGEPLLTVRGLTRQPDFHDVTFDVFPGEIVGLGGLVGAGRSEVARSLFGVDCYDLGGVEIAGEPLTPGSVVASCEAGMALVPEDRQVEGLVQEMSILDNVNLPWLVRMSRMGCLSRRREMASGSEIVRNLGVRFGRISDAVSSLSGGNQQKVVLGKWLSGKPKVLILDEPTRGVDVGAKEEVYELVQKLACEGIAILLISSDLPELIRLSDRIIVMCEGRVAGELGRKEICEESVLRLSLPEHVVSDVLKQKVEGQL